MDCPRCHHSNRESARFCGQCGASLVRSVRCNHCGGENPPEQLFCDECGRRLDADPAFDAERDPRTYTPKHLADKILTTRGAIEGERKHVTVLFADVAGYTSFAERADPEDVHSVMDRCFQLILEQVHRFEGTINQFTGDGVMALFGAPIALEDAPVRAIKTALAIDRALEPIDREVTSRYGRPFRMRIGVHSGPVVIGRIGDDLRMDYTAVGDTTNLANRLQHLAEPGSVVLSEATRRLVAGFFDLRDLGEIAVKGRTKPVHAYAVVGERAAGGRIEAVGAGLTPLVARRRELAQLEAAFESAARGRGHVVFLVGEAGIGKSRMLYEFRRKLSERTHEWIEGRCASYARSAAFYAIADSIRRRFGIDDRDDDAAALEKIDRVDAGDDLDWTLPFVRALVGLPPGNPRVAEMSAVSRRSETFRALQARFQRAAERSPLVLVIEDLHWIDPASAEFLAFLAESVPATRALIVLTYRPGYVHPFGDRSYHVRLALQPLTETETAAMAGGLLETAELPAEIRELITRKADGNPFFIEEVTKSLLEEGVLRRAGGRIELARKLDEISVPDSIHDVIMARIDRLADEPKRAIQVASVIGREFALRLLQRIVEAGEHVASLVDELRALELIYEKAAHPELAFMFKHALTHEVAYESVLVQRRKVLHGVVATAIEDLYRDRLTEHFEALAHHFTQAEMWQKALEYHGLAAEKANDAYANHTATDHWRQALEIADRLGGQVTDERRIAILEQLARVSFYINDFRGAGDALRRLDDLVTDPSERAIALSRAAWSYHWGHDYDLAQRALADARRVSGERGALEGTAMVGLMDGFIRATQGDLRVFKVGIDDALRACGEGSPVREMAEFFDGEMAEWCGDFQRAATIFESILTRPGALDDAMMRTHAEWFAGKAACCLGLYGDALSRLRDGVERAHRIGDRAMQSRLLNTLGWCYAEFGCHRLGVEFNARATEIGRELVTLELVAGAPELYGNAAINLALDRIAFGDLEPAAEALASVRSDLERSTDPWMRWRYVLHLEHAQAELALAQGNAEAALRAAIRERNGARRHDAAKIEARAMETVARALLSMDRRDEAREAVDGALAIADRIEYPPVRWRSHALLAEIARRQADRKSVDRHVKQTRTLIERCARTLQDPALRVELTALGERLGARPVERI